MHIGHWIGAIAIAANQLFNAMIGGDPQMSPSARAGLAREHGSKGGAVACKIMDWIDFKDGDGPKGDHCEEAVTTYWTRKAK